MRFNHRWQFWIDRGGTFTDLVGRDPDGNLHTLKLLSENPEQYRDAAAEGVRRLLGLHAGQPITPALVECVKMGTTVATNALLARTGEPTVLVTTRGFRDALRIATQARPRIFDRRIVLPELLYDVVVEADERVAADGAVVTPLDESSLRHALQTAHERGVRACAIVFLHGYRFHGHELAAERIARELGFLQVSVSHQVSPLMKFVPRGDTTVVDAYLSPILRRYVDDLAGEMPGVPLLFMQSSGGLALAGRFQGKDAVLSGPAGGVVGMVRTAVAAGRHQVIGFDMGGTSTDVSHYDGELERTFETEVAGVRIRVPMMSIHTVAAGGGSVISFDGSRLRVGPASAGADPGPAAYRRGGPLTTTDANVMLGRLQPAHFPKVFGPSADAPLDAEIVRRRFATLADEIAATTGRAIRPEQVARGAIEIAVENMANAIRKVSVARGHDVTAYTLQCFGGAGGQHACAVADALSISRILSHPMAGVMSAFGMGLADQTAIRQAAVERALDLEGLVVACEIAGRLRADADAELIVQGVRPAEIEMHHRMHLRYAGTDTALTCGFPRTEATAVVIECLRSEFERAYRQRFAFLLPDRQIIIEAVSAEAVARGMRAEMPRGDIAAVDHVPTPADSVEMYCHLEMEPVDWRRVELYVRESLAPGATIAGPAIIAERNATTVVDAGWRARVQPGGVLELVRERASVTPAVGVDADPVMLEVFGNLFMNVAEQMGLRLQNTAHSVNIKERLDFSCAVFDGTGNLIANAPHMPVHLGSMSESIRSVIDRNPRMRAGDVFAVNDPYHGGTHLPDITVVTPVFLDADQSPAFYVASRGHHADIGGVSPGSMPPFSTSIADEGMLIDNFMMVSAGIAREAEFLARLTTGAHPARNPSQNVADLRAQIAANEQGVREVLAVVAKYGRATVAAYMAHVQHHAEEAVRRVIATLDGGEASLPLDNGAVLRVRVVVDRATRSATIDFTGTSGALPNNFNAPRAITTAAVLYVFRTLVDDDIPLNAGCLRPLRLIVPEGCMLDPHPPAAVVAGNVETSSCVTNALYAALGVMASSQCTMNNFTFGDDQYQYYETIAGGAGAGPGFPGASVVQTHMTNSRITDPEILEFRYPVRLDSFEIRSGSGGAGCWRGGDGGTRRIRFLRPMTASILSNGRKHGAVGAAGGGDGAVGANWVERVDRGVERLGHIAQVAMNVGDVFVIETPGGGGYGSPSSEAECGMSTTHNRRNRWTR